MRQIICAGDLCCDLIVPYGRMQQALRLGDISKETTDQLQVSMRCGGSVGNVARHLGALGDNPIFVTPLKMDSLGLYLSEQMQEAGVDMRWVSDSERSNMYCVAVLDESGERTMFCFIPPWADYPRFNDKSFLRVREGIGQKKTENETVNCTSQKTANSIQKEDLILFTSGMAFLDDEDNNRSVLDFFKAEKANGATIVFDLNVRAESYGYEGVRRAGMEEMIAMSDIVLGSGPEEFAQVTGSADIPCAAQILLSRMQKGTVIARDGKAPILVESTNEGERTSEVITPLPVRPVSTLGAGDSFDAMFLSELSRGEDILIAVKNASDYAGRFISTRH